MKALSIIKSEHRNLGAVLFSLEKLAGQIEKGKSPEFKVFHGLLTYIDRFLNRFHHPKEDSFLFPILRTRCPEISAVLAEREQEHVDGDILFVELLKSLSAYEFIGDSEFANFHDALYRYTTFEKLHAIKEEQLILPPAREHLQPEDWREIDAAFADHEDPLFGDAPQGEFEELYKAIAAIMPPPYGAGPEWK